MKTLLIAVCLTGCVGGAGPLPEDEAPSPTLAEVNIRWSLAVFLKDEDPNDSVPCPEALRIDSSAAAVCDVVLTDSSLKVACAHSNYSWTNYCTWRSPTADGFDAFCSYEFVSAGFSACNYVGTWRRF